MPALNTIRFDNVHSVEFSEGRWTVQVTVTLTDGTEHKYIASADSGDTDGSGIWFGTREVYEAKS